MKGLKKYLNNRQEAIDLILKKPKQLYTAETFHKLRVEIKKLRALFELINHCASEFKKDKNFAPFKLIFRQAGKVRELQVEEAMLKKHFKTNLLKEYKAHLKKLKLEEQEKYFSIINKKEVKILAPQYSHTIYYLKEVNEKKATRYLKKKRLKIGKIIRQKMLSKIQLHELRKKLKTFNYNLKMLDLLNKNKSIHKKNILPELLGKWHDCEITIGNLKKEIKNANIKEKDQLNKIGSKISSESKILLNKIKSALTQEGSQFISS